MIPIHIDCKSNQRHCNGAVILKLQYANHPKADFNCYSSTIISPFIKSSSSSSSSFFPFFSFYSFFFRDLPISFLPCQQAALLAAPESRGLETPIFFFAGNVIIGFALIMIPQARTPYDLILPMGALGIAIGMVRRVHKES